MWSRIPIVDKVLALLALVMVLVAGDFVVRYGPLPEYLIYVAIHLGFALVLMTRRVWVIPSFVVSYTLLGLLAVLLQVSRVNLGVSPMVVAAPLSLLAITRWGPNRWWGMAALMIGVAGSFFSPILEFGVPGIGVAAHVLVLIACYLWATQQRTLTERHDEELKDQERAHRTREAQAIATERTLISREVHDIVAHNLAVVRVQASTALALETPEQMRTAMVDIRDISSSALNEVRDLVGVLRDSPDGVPAGDLTTIPQVIEQARVAGAQVTAVLPDEGTLRQWQDAWPVRERSTVLRVLQEGLTNVIKHGGHRPVVVVEAHAVDGECHLMITNEAAVTPGTPGFGLIGLRERVSLSQGRFEAGPWGGGFRLDAWIPVRQHDV